MANKERNKRSARQARQRERAVLDEMQGAAASSDTSAKKPNTVVKVSSSGAKSGLFARAGNYLRAVRGEMHRVVWPSRSELVNYSVAVTVMLLVFGVLVWAVDTGFVALLVAFTSLRG